MNTPGYRDLDEALASLPRALEPARDLWPGIAAATHGRQAQRWPLALAASVAVIGLVGALGWSVWRVPHDAPLAARVTPAPAATGKPVSFEPPQDAAYVAARAALERSFNDRLAMLAPATRTRVQADLATIRKANQDIREALASDPASPLLLQLLRSTWQQEIDLYTNVSRSTDPIANRRTRT